MTGIGGLMRRHTALWRLCDGSRGPRRLRRYTTREQASRELEAERFLNRAESHLRRHGDSKAEAAVLGLVGRFATSALDLNDGHLNLLVHDGFPKVGRALAEAARRFDPGMTAIDIFQASRNAFTAGGLQVLLGRPMELTPAIFGYSMLYPYTDNHLDNPDTPRAAKEAFNQHLERRLRGQAVEPADEYERKVWALVAMIESQYERAQYPALYRSLLAIQDAQEASVGLRRGALLPPSEVLSRVFAKGGASVLADGYLAAGRLTPEQVEFAFGWGVLLQLGDDLQDVGDDITGGIATLFSETAGRYPLDRLTNRVFEFSDRVLMRLRTIRAPGTGPLKQLIRRSAATLLTTAAGTAHRLYTNGYVQALERHSPFRFSFVREQQKRLFGSRGLIASLVEAAS